MPENISKIYWNQIKIVGATAIFRFHPLLGYKVHFTPSPGIGAARTEPEGFKYLFELGPTPSAQKNFFGVRYSFATG